MGVRMSFEVSVHFHIPRKVDGGKDGGEDVNVWEEVLCTCYS
jgi:hypothetical protein